MDFLRELNFIKDSNCVYPYLSLNEKLKKELYETQVKTYVFGVFMLLSKIDEFLTIEGNQEKLSKFCFLVNPTIDPDKRYTHLHLSSVVDIEYCNLKGRKVPFYNDNTLTQLAKVVRDYTHFIDFEQSSAGTLVLMAKKPSISPWIPINDYRKKFLEIFLSESILKTLAKNELEMSLPTKIGNSSKPIKV